MYFRDANIALIVFDVTNRRSLECVEYWAEEVRSSEVDDSYIILVGNKSDLDEKRQVSKQEGERKSKEIDAVFYYETTAVDNASVEMLF